jgi:hypothetical protein
MSWARSVPKEEDQTVAGIRPVVVRKKGFYVAVSPARTAYACRDT